MMHQFEVSKELQAGYRPPGLIWQTQYEGGSWSTDLDALLSRHLSRPVQNVCGPMLFLSTWTVRTVPDWEHFEDE